MEAQKDLIDLIVQGVGRDWRQILGQIMPSVLLLSGAAAAAALLSSFMKMANIKITEEVRLHLQGMIHRIALDTPLEHMENADFYDKLQRARATVEEDVVAIFAQLVQALNLIFGVIGIVVVVSSGHWLIGLWIGLFIPVAVGIRLRTEIKVRRLNREMTFEGRMADYIKSLLVDSYTMKELKFFRAAAHFMERCLNTEKVQNNRRGNLRRKEIKLGASLSFVHLVGISIAMFLMILKVDEGAITAGTIAVVFHVLLNATKIPLHMSWPLSKIYMYSAQVYDLIEFLSPANVLGRPQGQAVPNDCETIEFDNVSFKYPQSEVLALEDINMTIRAGEQIAITGENGAGKSTFVALLLGLYQPTSGHIRWNGVDISQLDPVLLWEKMSVVLQDFERYPLTLRENIELGNLNEPPGDERIIETLKACDLSDLYDKVGDLDVPLGRLMSGGQELSGGQWQKVAIARAMVRQSEVVVLDEPTASIDPVSEVELYNRFQEVARDKTTMFVSHRLGWARFAERILVFHQGQLVEDGVHDELMQRGEAGIYASAFYAQAAWYDD